MVHRFQMNLADDSKAWLWIRGYAFERGITEQEFLRSVAIPEWLARQPKDEEPVQTTE